MVESLLQICSGMKFQETVIVAIGMVDVKQVEKSGPMMKRGITNVTGIMGAPLK